MNPDTAEFLAMIGHYFERGIERQMPEYTEFVLNEANYAYFSHGGRSGVMNYSLGVFLINEDVRALYVIYEPDGEAKQRRYLVKTLDPAIEEGDFVVVPSTVGHKLTVAKVVDAKADVDFDSTTHVHWVVQRIDPSQFNDTVKLEAEAIDKMKVADLSKRRRNLIADMMTAEEVKALPLAKNTKQK